MAVPEQVRKQTEAVQQLYDNLNEAPEGSSSSDETTSAPVEVAPQLVNADSVNEQAAISESVEQGSEPQEESYEQKYRTLQGMFDEQITQVHAQNRELSQRVGQFQQLLSTMEARTPQEGSAETPVPVSLLSDEEKEEYGESIDIMRKVSQEVAGGYEDQIVSLQTQIQQLQGAVVPRVEQLAQQQTHSAEQSFWAELSASVPNWREINDNPAFQAWLLEIDPLSGMARQMFLEDAQRNFDARRTAGFFTSWPGGTSTAQNTGSPTANELERQVAPGKGRSGPTPTSGEAKTYTKKDITKFFDDVRFGKFKGKEQERDTIEQDIFAAQREGRIVNA
tara:strand:- start:59 stop:1066 length:1008 start_codon:yes stop_codon:yes gene_type:complete